MQKRKKALRRLNNRTHGLPPRTRQLLILLDGKRNVGEVTEMLPGRRNGDAVWTELFAGGFIESLQRNLCGESPGCRTAVPKPVAVKPAAKVERPQNDAERLEMAKNFMRNTVKAFLGGMGSGFISHIDKCNDFEELRT